MIPANVPMKPTPAIAAYERAYRQVAQRLGHRAPGRNVVRWGILRGGRPRRASIIDVERSTAVLRRMLTAPARTSTATAGVAISTPTAQAAVVSPMPTCTWQPESGGNPRAVNSSSGAGGYYQIMPSTWRAYGGQGLPQDAPLSVQTQVAERVLAGQGIHAWVNC